MTALVRYVVAVALRTQRLVPPVVLYVVVLATASVAGGSVLPGFATSAAALFPVAAWLARVAATAEDPVLAQVTAINAGGYWRTPVAAAITAGGGSGILGLLAVVVTLGSDHFAAPVGTVVAGVVAEALAVVAGTAAGCLASAPLVRRPGWALFAVVYLVLAELIIPWFPPVRGVLQLFDAARPHLATGLIAIAAETVPAAVALVGVSAWLAGRRS